MRLYDIDYLVAWLGKTRRTIYKYIEQGRLNAIKVGGTWKITEEEIERIEEEGI